MTSVRSSTTGSHHHSAADPTVPAAATSCVGRDWLVEANFMSLCSCLLQLSVMYASTTT
jgi:hypothetical protein